MTESTSQPARNANEKSGKTPELGVCPECGSELTARKCSYDDISVTITVCTGFPRCNLFYWSTTEGNPHSSLVFGELGDWAIKKSLEVLHDELSPEEWREALAELRRPNRLKGGDGSG